jgi:hypothetical protein
MSFLISAQAQLLLSENRALEANLAASAERERRLRKLPEIWRARLKAGMCWVDGDAATQQCIDELCAALDKMGGTK